MSFIFENTNKDGDTREITILERDEFFVLTDEEKLDYQSGPKIKEEGQDYTSNTLHIQGFIYDIINEYDSGDNGIPEMLDQFMKTNFEEQWQEGLSEYPSRSDREEFFWDFIDTEGGDEALDGIDLFIINQFYQNDHLYSVLIDECKARI